MLSCIGMFSFLHGECINLQKGHLCDKMNLKILTIHKARVANNSQEKFSFYIFPTWDFFVIQCDQDEILLYGSWLEK